MVVDAKNKKQPAAGSVKRECPRLTPPDVSVSWRSVRFMMYTFISPVPADRLRSLPTRDIAFPLLEHLAKVDDYLQYRPTMGGAREVFRDEPDADVLVDRLSDAWSWLEEHALLSSVPSQDGNFRQVSREGRELLEDPQGILRVDARHRLAGPLHPALDGRVRINFDLGDYETACFAAMKAVEVAVRDAADFDHSLFGTDLMRTAFATTKNGSPQGR
ncbi:TIGR02391 family protein [Streptomyces sp. NPDC018000]|uniref:TIGR02391 family protein n=1 Tax=Streptomyces sp. NPDC018000 TaxID=3365028 RepID=UPI003788364B